MPSDRQIEMARAYGESQGVPSMTLEHLLGMAAMPDALPRLDAEWERNPDGYEAVVIGILRGEVVPVGELTPVWRAIGANGVSVPDAAMDAEDAALIARHATDRKGYPHRVQTRFISRWVDVEQGEADSGR